jgi:catechol 2,3-dioxygenase
MSEPHEVERFNRDDPTFKLPAETGIGPVALTVADMDRSLAFYEGMLGLQVRRQQDDTIMLQCGGTPLVFLKEDPAARPYPRTTGLFHFALLVPNRRELARTLQRLLTAPSALQGYSDHAVSEALYLADPDGNGIEIYRDRPREEWPVRDGKLLMTTEPLDVHGLLAEVSPTDAWSGLPAGTRMGHIHLRVDRIAPTETFYTQVLGFDLMVRYGTQASFLAAGGYHHHVGINTWGSAGAPPPPPHATGLRWYTILLPDDEALSETARHLENVAGDSMNLERRSDGLFVRDPAGNGILLTTN